MEDCGDFLDRESELLFVRQAMEAHFSQKQFFLRVFNVALKKLAAHVN